MRTGKRLIAKQTLIIQDLHRGGHDTAIARAILRTFRELQETFEGDLARLPNDHNVGHASHHLK